MTPRIFVSAPSVLLPPQEDILNEWFGKLTALNLRITRLERRHYEPSVWHQLQRLVTTSHGVLALGFHQLSIHAGKRRSATDEEASGVSAWTSPWIHLEVGLGIASGLPVLAVADPGVKEGVFDPCVWTPPLYGLTPKMRQDLPSAWVEAVYRLRRGDRSAA